MLHLIFQSPLEPAILDRIGAGDDVIFLENAAYLALKDNKLSNKLEQRLKDNIQLFVLFEELETRGFNNSDLLVGINTVDYVGFVKLTEKNKVVATWT